MDEIYTVPEAADRLKKSATTVYRLLESGELRASKVRGSWLITESAIQELLRRHERGSNDDRD